MTDKTSAKKTSGLLREKFLVLGAISTLQPIDPDALLDALASDLSKRNVNLALELLRKDALIARLKDGRLRVTYKGQKVFASRFLGKARDISRMLFLVRKDKGGG